MNNLLEDWKQECYLLSSPLARNKQLERSDVNAIYKIFEDYFGLDYFKIESPEIGVDSNSIWLFSLLANHNRPACIAALFETANILRYLETLSPSIQKKFKSLFKDPNQFRNMFFELYVYRLLDYNRIQNVKKPKEGEKELEGTCTINGKEFLFECRKLYVPDINLLDAMVYALEKLFLKLSALNKGFGLIGTIKFKKPNDIKAKEIFNSKLSGFITGFNEQTFQNIDYHHSDNDGELSIVNYNTANNIEVDKNFQQYHVVFKIIPPFNPVPGIPNHYTVELKCNFSIPQSKVTRKLFSAITDKKKQHADSKYPNKIYFIDSETIPDFTLPIFRMDSMFEEGKIKEFLNSFSENEIVCFIRREYMDDIPRISIKAFGKNIDEKVKQRLESLKTNFDYHIDISYKKPFTLNPIFRFL